MGQARIMIVEDNAMVARDLRDCLEELGYEVVCTRASGEQSIDSAEALRPDAVIMDIHLRGEMDGIEAAEQIYARRGIPVVFLSAFSDRELLERAKRVGSFGYMIKPFEERELYAMLEIALYKARAEKQRARVEARLRQAEKAEGLRVMAGSIAHNFNNMLQATLSYLELAREQLPADSDAEEYVQGAEDSVVRAAEMSTQMLRYVGQARTAMCRSNLSRLVEGASDLLRASMRGEISLSMDLAREDAAIDADHGQVHQVVMHLFNNAVEAIGKQPGTVTIATRVVALDRRQLEESCLHQDLPAGDYAVLEITDTGCGMDHETAAKVFDPFLTTQFIGRGLGLADALGIVQGHGGGIAIDSEPGKGTTLRVLFPVVGKLEAAPPPESAIVDDRQRPATILLVDDEDLLRRVETEMLEQAGYTVMFAADGREAVEVFRRHADRIDCVLLDLAMPRMDGEACFEALRRINNDVRVVLSSGFPESNVLPRFAGRGLAGFLHKPYTSAALKEKLRRVLATTAVSP